MDFLETMIARNARFAETAFAPELKILPSAGTIVVGCVDPRVDPAYVLGLEQGEVAVIRNVGGRITPALLETLAVLRVVAKAAGPACVAWFCSTILTAESSAAIIMHLSCWQVISVLTSQRSTTSRSSIPTRRSPATSPRSKPATSFLPLSPSQASCTTS